MILDFSLAQNVEMLTKIDSHHSTTFLGIYLLNWLMEYHLKSLVNFEARDFIFVDMVFGGLGVLPIFLTNPFSTEIFIVLILLLISS